MRMAGKWNMHSVADVWSFSRAIQTQKGMPISPLPLALHGQARRRGGGGPVRIVGRQNVSGKGRGDGGRAERLTPCPRYQVHCIGKYNPSKPERQFPKILPDWGKMAGTPMVLPMEPAIGDASMLPLSWIVLAGLQSAFFLGFTMGANDVANAFGSSVGAGVGYKSNSFQTLWFAAAYEHPAGDAFHPVAPPAGAYGLTMWCHLRGCRPRPLACSFRSLASPRPV